MKVLVTDGDQRPALAIVRALGRRGSVVLVGSDRRRSLASASKYCRRSLTYPSPSVSRQAFDGFLLDFVRRERVDVVVPVTDVTTQAVCAHQDALRRYCAMAVPPLEAFELVTDKSRLLERAKECGIPVPQTRFVHGPGALSAQVEGLEYPAVVKPFRSRIRTKHGWQLASVHYARTEHDLRRLYSETSYLASHPSLIQPRIMGPGIGVFVLFDRGTLLTGFAHRRIREKPPAGGVSVLRESIPLDPELRDHAIRLLGPIGWHGVAMLEFKQDSRSGTCFLMEVNGRFWGSLQLAIDAGINFPILACEMAIGRQPAVSRPYTVGVKSRWLLGDLDHLLLRLFKNGRELHLPPSAPSKLRTIVDFLKFVEPNLHYEVIDFEDPRPFVYELGQSARALTRSGIDRVRRILEGQPCSPSRAGRASHEPVG
jgi:predicted ATP-grasp superfamily ATP-dependent carboligase